MQAQPIDRPVWRSQHSAAVPAPPVPVPKGLWPVLYHRGLQNQSDIEQHFACSFKTLRSPWLLDGMQQAVDILEHAQNKHICIYADFDLDGTPGLALLHDGLRSMGYTHIDCVQPLRLSQGYGVHTSIVDQLAARGVELLITVDLGVTDIKAITRAKQLGLQVVVTDHHLPKNELPPADAIVNPNKKQCQSALGHLCGAGVAFYLLLALRQRLKVDCDLKSLLDCVAIATITDCVPLIEENRVLVKHGLLQLQHTRRPGLAALLRALSLNGRVLSAYDVAFKFAPKLNALSRMEDEAPIDLFLTQDLKQAASLAQRAIEVHKKRVQVQAEAEQELGARRHEHINFVWAWSKAFHPGVVGLLATRMAEQHRVPAFVGVQRGDSIVGSARAFKDEHVLKALEFSRTSLLRFGGHAQAAGFELRTDQDSCFQEHLQTFFGRDKKNIPFEFYYDAPLEARDLDDEFMRCYDAMGPFGMGFKAPVFYMPRVRVSRTVVLKGGHVKLYLERPDGPVVRLLDGICFVPKLPQLRPRYYKLVERLQGTAGAGVDALVEPQWNYFNGHKNIQLLIHDFELTDSS